MGVITGVGSPNTHKQKYYLATQLKISVSVPEQWRLMKFSLAHSAEGFKNNVSSESALPYLDSRTNCNGCKKYMYIFFIFQRCKRDIHTRCKTFL